MYLGVSVSKFLIGVLSCGNRRHGEVVRSFSAGLQPLAVGCLELQQRSVEDPHHVSHVYGQINVYGVTTKSERHKRSYWTRTADGNGIGGRKAPVPYGS